ncbi:phycobiliprotein lyase [Leptolyngbya sp. 7M]|nr:phycobiliprotein lyase [Leptolyngbya sp. 7M]
MDITAFVANSVGRWRSQRSAHHLAFGHFEAIMSDIEIVALTCEDPAVITLCHQYGINPATAVSPFRMSWQGQSDWDESEVQGRCVLVPIPDPSHPNHGKLLRNQGYAETIAAIGQYYLSEDGTFVLTTPYDRAAAEEKIWFVNPHLRCRVSLIKTSAGTGVVTASFASEIRQPSST